jgi:hypothetical protein
MPLYDQLDGEVGTGFFVGWKVAADYMNEISHIHGWWETRHNDFEKMALIHSEISEAVEGLRKGNPPDEHLPQFKSVEVELADAVIRIMDFEVEHDLNVIGAIFAKAKFNESRSYRHGGKLA